MSVNISSWAIGQCLMPALHDFARFVFYAQEVATIAAHVLAVEERRICSSVIVTIHQQARGHLGRGKLPGHLVLNSARAVLPQLAPDHAVVVSTAQNKFHAAIDNTSTDGYGVLRAYNSGVLIKAVVAACIDDVLDEPIWRHAFRYAATLKLDSANDLQNSLHVMLIARAFEQGALLKSLLPLDFDMDADLMTMFGQYVSSQSVTARDILQDVVSSATASAPLQRVAMESVMWNLTALDHNGTARPVGMQNRLSHNMLSAGVVAEKLYNSSLLNIVEEAEIGFFYEMRTAKADASKLVRRKGRTYVTKLRGRQAVAWMYITGVIAFAISCASFNWAGRDVVFDRAKDAFEISTIFLVSVFGLVKLASEDPNALKNLATGKSLVEDLTEASKYLRSNSKSIQKLLSVDPNEGDWASADGCSYARAVNGIGLDMGPADVATLKQCGFFLLEGICKRPYFWDTYDAIENIGMEVAQISPESDSAGELQFSNVPRFSKLA